MAFSVIWAGRKRLRRAHAYRSTRATGNNVPVSTTPVDPGHIREMLTPKILEASRRISAEICAVCGECGHARNGAGRLLPVLGGAPYNIGAVESLAKRRADAKRLVVGRLWSGVSTGKV